MCIICIEWQRTKDLIDARRMLESARREPQSIDADHLLEVERRLDAAAAAKSGQPVR